MLPTFVNKRVTGAERGDFYALDLGGTNFRVLRLTLEGDGKVGPVKSMKFSIPDAAKTGTGAELFGFIADSVARFIAIEVNPNPNPYPNPNLNPNPNPYQVIRPRPSSQRATSRTKAPPGIPTSAVATLTGPRSTGSASPSTTRKARLCSI